MITSKTCNLPLQVDELEAQLIDLHEQVDAALGADEMVEQLAEKKMELEDKVRTLNTIFRHLQYYQYNTTYDNRSNCWRKRLLN